MEVFRQNPFIRILIPFLLGIYFADYYFKEYPWQSSLLIQIEIVLTSLLILIHYFLKAYKTVFGFVVFVHLFFLGMIMYNANNPISKENHFSAFEDCQYYVGVVKAVVEKKTRNELRVAFEYCGIQKDSFCVCSGDAILYSPLDSVNKIELGDRIQFLTDLRRLNKNPNPHAFDYSKYLFYQKIHFTGFLNEGDWTLLEKNKVNLLLQWASICREKSYQILKYWISNKDNLSIASAMVLGQRSDLNDEIKDAFIDSGAIHVLAVSGLHVGILSMILLWLLNFLPSQSFRVKIFRYLIYLSVIWMFALVTGAGPAVIRACLMFSLYFSAGIFSKTSSSFNSLAAAAFIILLNNPYQLFYLGFQFSFLAITSILVFMPLVQNYYRAQHFVIRYILDLIVLSCVAQILVAPLGIAYFNKFALYFILSGLVVVPAAFVILCCSIGLLVFDFVIPSFNTYIFSPILNFTLDVLRKCVLTIQDFPSALLKDIYLDNVQICLLYGLVLSFTLFFIRSKKYLVIVCLMIFLLNAYALWDDIEKQQDAKCFVYDIRGSSLVDFCLGGKLVTYSSEGLQAKQIEFTANSNRNAQRIKSKIDLVHLDKEYCNVFFYNPPFFQLGEKVILLVNSPENLYSDYSMCIDYLILTNATEVDLEMLLQHYFVRFVIIDSSYRHSLKQKYVDILDKVNIEYSLTKEKVIEIHG